MKKLVLLLSIVAAPAFAQIEFDEVRIAKKTLVSVHKLSCNLVLGRNIDIRDRLNTSLGHYYSAQHTAELEFDHAEARALGCEVGVLDQMVKDSHMRFGHVDGEVIFVKRTAKAPRMVFGKCQRNYQEQIIFKLEDKIELKTSLLGKLVPATGCK